jgi:hypothetical protein
MLPITSSEGLGQLSTVFNELLEARRARRAARLQQQELTALLSGSYTSAADRAEMDAILGRYEESATHRAWDAVGARA